MAGLIASDIEIKQIPCSITSMAFFDKLKDSNNNIVNDSDHIRQRFDIEIDGILVSNNLRGVSIFLKLFHFAYTVYINIFIFNKC